MKVSRWFLIGTLLTLAAPLCAQSPPSPQEMAAERAALFDKADTDGDGKLSPDEFRTFESSLHQKMVQHFTDANGNGAAPPPFPTINPDAHFKQLDTNGDGAVSLNELEAERPRFAPRKPPPF